MSAAQAMSAAQGDTRHTTRDTRHTTRPHISYTLTATPVLRKRVAKRAAARSATQHAATHPSLAHCSHRYTPQHRYFHVSMYALITQQNMIMCCVCFLVDGLSVCVVTGSRGIVAVKTHNVCTSRQANATVQGAGLQLQIQQV